MLTIKDPVPSWNSCVPWLQCVYVSFVPWFYHSKNVSEALTIWPTHTKFIKILQSHCLSSQRNKDEEIYKSYSVVLALLRSPIPSQLKRCWKLDDTKSMRKWFVLSDFSHGYFGKTVIIRGLEFFSINLFQELAKVKNFAISFESLLLLIFE